MFSQVKEMRNSSIKDTEQKYSKPKDVYKFEGKCVDNKSWFELNFDFIDTNSNTIDLEFYKRFLRPYISGRSYTEAPIFSFIIGYSKKATQPTSHPKCTESQISKK